MARTAETSQVPKGGFLFSGTIFEENPTDAVGCVPSDDEMRQQAEVEAARVRYKAEHATPNITHA